MPTSLRPPCFGVGCRSSTTQHRRSSFEQTTPGGGRGEGGGAGAGAAGGSGRAKGTGSPSTTGLLEMAHPSSAGGSRWVRESSLQPIGGRRGWLWGETCAVAVGCVSALGRDGGIWQAVGPCVRNDDVGWCPLPLSLSHIRRSLEGVHVQDWGPGAGPHGHYNASSVLGSGDAHVGVDVILGSTSKAHGRYLM
jgi:hypothetical protein